MSRLQQFHAASTSAAAQKLRSLRTKLKCEGFPEPFEHGKITKRIVAVGAQSADKSALISMLTGVKLESSTSATTRGPMVFRFDKGSTSPSAKIWVEIVEDMDGKALPQVIKEKETVVALTELPEKHREYARLVLNADIDDGELVDDCPLIATDRPIADCDRGKFTRNRIVIEIFGDKYPKLEIVDLPGLQAANENKEVQDKIRSITEEELALPRTIALIVCPATSEPVHHSILSHIRRTDAKYERTIIALSRSDELSAQSSPWLKEMKEFPNSHCFVASNVPSGIREDLATLEKHEAGALNASKKAAHHVLRQVPVMALGIANLARLIVGKFGLDDRRRLTDLMQSFKKEIKLMDEAAGAHSRPEIIAKINLAVDHVSLQLSKRLIAVDSSDTDHRDRHAAALRTLLLQQLPAFVHGSHHEQHAGRHVIPAHLGSDECFDRVRHSIQQTWAGVIQRHYEQLRACSQHDFLQSVNMVQDTPSPVKAKITEAVEGLLSASFMQTEAELRKLSRRYSGDTQRSNICSDPATKEEYQRRFLSLDLGSLSPVTPTLQTRMQLPPTPPSSAPSKRSAEDDLESPRRHKKWSQPDFIDDLADRTAAHRLRLLDVYINICLDRLCQGYADIVSEAFTDVANSDIAHEIRNRIGTDGLIDLDTVKVLMTSVEGVKDAAERRAKLEKMITLGDTALSV